MAKMEMRVQVVERQSRAVEGGRNKAGSVRHFVEFKPRPDLGFVVQGNVPSELRKTARDQAEARMGSTHRILQVCLAVGGFIQCIVEPRPVR